MIVPVSRPSTVSDRRSHLVMVDSINEMETRRAIFARGEGTGKSRDCFDHDAAFLITIPKNYLPIRL